MNMCRSFSPNHHVPEVPRTHSLIHSLTQKGTSQEKEKARVRKKKKAQVRKRKAQVKESAHESGTGRELRKIEGTSQENDCKSGKTTAHASGKPKCSERNATGTAWYGHVLKPPPLNLVISRKTSERECQVKTYV